MHEVEKDGGNSPDEDGYAAKISLSSYFSNLFLTCCGRSPLWAVGPLSYLVISRAFCILGILYIPLLAAVGSLPAHLIAIVQRNLGAS